MSRRIALVACLLLPLTGAACTDMISDTVEFAEIEVWARTPSGAPVPGARIALRVWPPRVLSVGHTGPDGRYVFRWVPPDNSYAVEAMPPKGFEPPENYFGGPSTAWRDGIEMKSGERRSFTFEFLEVGPGSIVAWVVDAEGEGIPGVRLAAYSADGSMVLPGLTQQNGAWVFRSVPFGHWGIQAVPPKGYALVEEDVLYSDGLVISGGVESEARIVMDLASRELCSGSIEVTVREPEGTPARRYPVRLYGEIETLEIDYTDSQGTLAFTGLLCGRYSVGLVPLRGWILTEGEGTSYVDGIEIAPGRDGSVAFTAEECHGRIVADVRDSSDRPVAGAALTLYTASDTIQTDVTAADGAATFVRVTCGVQHGLSLTPPPGYVSGGPSFIDGLEVTSHGELLAATFEVLPVG